MSETLVAPLIVAVAWAFALPATIGGGTWGSDEDARVDVERDVVAEDHTALDVGVVDPHASRPRWQRAPMCTGWAMTGEDPHGVSVEFFGAIPSCGGPEGEVTAQVECADGEAVQDPLWRSDPIEGTDLYGGWRRVSYYTCASDPVHVLAIQAWESMTITPEDFTLQPDTGWATTHQGIYAIPDADHQTINVTLAGTPVLLRATPTTWTWTSSDGDEHTHHQPSGGYTSDDAPITFTPGERRIGWNLTTTWEGSYSLNDGDTWIDAPGTATTTSEPVSIHLYSPTPRLVDCDLNGNCASGERAPTGPVPTITDPDADGTDNYTIPDSDIDTYLNTVGHS